MNELYLDNKTLPVVCALDSRIAAEPFFHADRILEYNDLIYVFEGAIYVTEENIDYTVPEGSMLILKHGLRHFGKAEIPKGTRWLFVHFFLEDSHAPDLTDDASEIGGFERLERRVRLPKQLFGLTGSEPERRLSELVAYSGSQRGDKRFRLNLMLAEALSEAALYGRAEPSLADRVASYIQRNIRVPFSAAALEREFFLSYKRLAAVFKAEKGRSMQQYHSELRLSEAAMLLRTTALPIGEIAAEMGISAPLYFSRCFSARFGASPREYRRKMSVSY